MDVGWIMRGDIEFAYGLGNDRPSSEFCVHVVPDFGDCVFVSCDLHRCRRKAASSSAEDKARELLAVGVCVSSSVC